MEIYLHDINDLSLIPQIWLTIKLEPYSLLNNKIISILESLAVTQLAELIEIIIPNDSTHKQILQNANFNAGLSSYTYHITSSTPYHKNTLSPVPSDYKLELLLPLLKQQAIYHHNLSRLIYNQPENIDWEWYFKIFRDHITKTHDPIFVFEKDQTPIGLLTTFSSGNQFNFWDLFVDSAYRGQGIGKLLVSSAEVYCHNHEIDMISLETWTQDTTLHDFYTKLGFKLTAESYYKIIV